MINKMSMSIGIDALKELLHYDSDTGIFIRKIQRQKYLAGTKAGCNDRKGYVVIMIDGRSYFAHRLAWAYVNGLWPQEQIDHINGVKDDNRICNLRLATNGQNQANSRPRNQLGLKGVHRVGTKWISRITANKKRIRLGTFDSPEEAHAVYLAEAKRHFGEFARGQ